MAVAAPLELLLSRWLVASVLFRHVKLKGQRVRGERFLSPAHSLR